MCISDAMVLVNKKNITILNSIQHVISKYRAVSLEFHPSFI